MGRVETEEQKARRKERKRGYAKRDKADPVAWAKIQAQNRASDARRRAKKEMLQSPQASGSANAPGFPADSTSWSFFAPSPFCPPVLSYGSFMSSSTCNVAPTPVPHFGVSERSFGVPFNDPSLTTSTSSFPTPLNAPTQSVPPSSNVLGSVSQTPHARPYLVSHPISDSEARRVMWMASSDNSTDPDTSIIRHLDQNAYNDNRELTNDIQEMMAHRKVVVVSKAVKPTGKKVETLDDIMGFGGGFVDGQKVQVHDLERCAKDPSKPHVEKQLRDFMKGINDVDQVGVILDLKTILDCMPSPFK
ncbi:hypothetical protein GYMLUDRAFT_61793 [Collybiopsis luxurians FD-317 M1]|uniref:Uncharacterized protein n=1 Tax=Collybiopsis luxurians FD-317 M1 TaxID=944289 RepID=A0A0D0C325_9AGAR|nr:hypothetical protein GYMLUDRAFT_61793 [Collybiopsis luxurians FD-317 M1]